MARLRLTEKAIRAAKTEHGQKDLRDSVQRGLVLRVYDSGRKTWALLYRTRQGRRRWYKLGVYPALRLKDARTEALDVLRRVAAGDDPQAEREKRRVGGGVETIEDLATDFLERYAYRNKRPRSIEEDIGQLERYVLPTWGKRFVAEIARRDVKRLLEDLADGRIARRGQPTTTAPRALRALLSKMFAWAVEEEIIPGNPAAGVPLPVRPESRDRVLSETELAALLRELDRLEKDAPLSATAFRLLLLTAQRPGEVLGMRWSEVSGDWWTIPKERHKGKQSHRVPLSPQALAVVEQVRRLTGNTKFVLDSPQKPGQPLSTLKTANHAIIRRVGMERWTPHDLRRTAATQMTSGGIPRFVVDRILGHAEHGVSTVYDRSSYDREKRQALNWWGTKFQQIASGETRQVADVVPISR
jgi:integrase